jgi:hypothetical protein
LIFLEKIGDFSFILPSKGVCSILLSHTSNYNELVISKRLRQNRINCPAKFLPSVK